ncbi:MAG: type II-A CRISPR-associated protein Csn2 [Clostridia bacterium]|nr:type II-A CRISPR-associated protein Csn2 [Clostridia bacterium]MDE6472216.1 type II-A CRISPR-associated protein Csn2 [Clostridia bacterium]
MTIRLFCSDYQLDILDDEVATLEVLNRDCFRRIINELKGTGTQEIREINLFNDNSFIDTKDMTIIFDPYEVDVNDKTYLSRLYKEIEKHFKQSDDNIFSLNELSAYINLHFHNLIFGYPLELTMKDELALKDYLKFLDVKVAEEDQSLLDRIIQFINVNGVIKFTKVIVFVNLKSMLTQVDIDSVIQSAIRTRCPLLLLENVSDNRVFPSERKLIVDEELFTVVK